ncbi:MAG TPA: hypothetical protein VMU81_04630 [Acetobacteraceae bacterium]|nr:hypothetical protein [Acetobacteraceae bacterium]
MLQYRATIASLDVVLIPSYEPDVSIVRNANLVAGTATCPLFVYQTPYTAFPSSLIPALVVPGDFDIGEGTPQQLNPALQAFLEGLLARSAAPAGAQRTLRVAASYGYEYTRGAPGNTVRGRRSTVLQADTGLVPSLPMALVPAIDLTISGDGNASIDSFAQNLANFIVAWDGQVQPSRANAALFFDVSLFSSNAASQDRPLVSVQSVRYGLTL